MAAIQGKQVFVLDARNAFQNAIRLDASKRTCNMPPPFFYGYIRLHWSDYPELDALAADPKQYAIIFCCCMLGEKDVGCKWCQLLSASLASIGMHCSVADHAVFSWRNKTSEVFLACAMDDCLCLADDRAPFLTLKTHLEKIFELPLREGDTLRFLNLQIIQSPRASILITWIILLTQPLVLISSLAMFPRSFLSHTHSQLTLHLKMH
jgi:hypothetical protein